MKLAHCYMCNQYKSTSEFKPNLSRHSGVHSRCRVCDNLRTIKRMIAKNSTEHRRLLYKEKSRRHSNRPENKFAYKMRAITRSAIKSGLLVRDKVCSKCKKYSRIIDAHHKDYRKPLSITWLCRKCHYWSHKITHPQSGG